jgi:threonine aldolase
MFTLEKKNIDLRSDTVTKPSLGMRQAIAQAEVGDDVFEDDPTVQKLEQTVAELLGKEKGLFVPSGTMANQIALRSLAHPGDEVLCEKNSHIFNYEVASASALSGLQLHPLIGNKGMITAEQIEPEIRPQDIHQAQTSLVAIENTHNRAGGTVFPLEEIKKIKELAKKYNMKMYLDGARLWNASVASSVPLEDYGKYFDAVSVCLSKGLGAPIGSVTCGTEEFIIKARRNRKMYGGGMRQVGIIAAAGIYAIENNFNRLMEDHRNAKFLAQNLAKIKGIQIDLESVQTNIVIFDIKNTGKEPAEISLKMKEKKVLLLPFGKTRMRAVTHLDVDREDITYAAEKFEEVFSE